MSQQMFETSSSPDVTLDQVSGDLQIKGWEAAQVVVKADPDELQISAKEDVVQLTCQGDCEVRLPFGSSVTIGEVSGDASIKLLEDQLKMGSVGGNLALRGVGAVQIDKVGGNFQAKGVSDDLQVGEVDGNADVRQAQGQCVLGQVKGNLDVQDVDGEIKAAVDGNARLRLSLMTGSEYSIQADGNVHCYVPEDASLKLNLSSAGEVIKLRLPGAMSTYHQSQVETTVGDGQVSLTLSAGGSLYLLAQESLPGRAEAPEGFPTGLPDDFGEQIARQVQSQIAMQMEQMTRQVNEQLSRLPEQFGKAGFAPEQIEQIMERARRESEREAARAQEKVARAQEKLERKLEAERRRAEHKAQDLDRRHRKMQFQWDFNWPSSSRPSVKEPPSKEPPSDEERLMILRMLEQKKISLEEAEKLLAALEGNE
jgi:hypothetical protein